MKRGWFSDSWRHSMAARGVKTSYMAKKSISGNFARSVLKAAKTPSGKRAAKIAAKGKAAEAREKFRELSPAEQRRQAELLLTSLQTTKERNLARYEGANTLVLNGKPASIYDLYGGLGIPKDEYVAAIRTKQVGYVNKLLDSVNPSEYTDSQKNVYSSRLEEAEAFFKGVKAPDRAAFAKAVRKNLLGEKTALKDEELEVESAVVKEDSSGRVSYDDLYNTAVDIGDSIKNIEGRL